MSGFSWRDIGSFESEADVNDWARRNGIAHGDVSTRSSNDGRVRAQVRNSAVEERSDGDLRDSKRQGYF